MIRQSTLVALALGASLPAYAAPQTAPAEAAKPLLDPQERICKEIDVSGIRMATRRVCATRSEWQAREQLDREEIQQLQRPIQECMIMGTRRC
jgi:hypothetical protein